MDVYLYGKYGLLVVCVLCLSVSVHAFEPCLCLHVVDSEGVATGEFFFDPDLDVTRAIGRWLGLVRSKHHAGTMQKPVIVSGIIKVL